MIKLVLIILCLSVTYVLGANILYVSVIPSRSHHIWNRAFAFSLANKGHNVTLIGPDKDKQTPANYSHIFVEGSYEIFQESVDMLEASDFSPMQMITEFLDMTSVFCNHVLNSQGVQELLEYPSDKFDLLIIDITAEPCLYPLIAKFNYPATIAVTPFLLPSHLAFNFGSHLHPAYVPWYGLPYTTNMSFMERLWNHIVVYTEIVLHQRSNEIAAIRKVFGDDIPSMEQLERHISLLLANTDPVLNYPQALPPNIISVGGLHTSRGKEIPKDLETVLNEAKNGIIVFSLGSNMRSDLLSKDTQKSLLDAFSNLSETVIWKFESDLENLPKNVLIRKWLPQNDILGHPNVKLFIGHGGALSTQEALYHGVPVLCVPFFFDQHVNARDLVNRELGVSLDYRKITKDYVLHKIREVLDNPVYSTNIKKVSLRYRDRSETALERAVFWAEFVIRHNGAHFLNTPARDLPFYKTSGLDLVAFLILVCTVIYLTLYKISKLVVSLLGSRQKLKTN